MTYTIERLTDDGWKAVVTDLEIPFAAACLIADHASLHPTPTQAQVIDAEAGVVAVYEAGRLIVLNGRAV